MKIVYCLNSIRGLGGVQRVTIVKVNAFADIEGNEVYVVVTDNKHATLVSELSPKVHLIDLNINYYRGDRGRSKIANIIVYKQKMRKHRKALEAFLRNLKPSIVVSVGGFEKYMLLSMRNRTWMVVREFHFVRNYRKDHCKTWFDRVQATLTDFYDFHFMEKKYDRIVILTDEDKEKNWKGWNNVEVIPNPVSYLCNDPSPLTDRCIAYAGRFDPIKNCRSMVNAFRIVAQRHPDWILKLYGEGNEYQSLKNQISELGLENNVLLMGFTKDIMNAYRQSSISLLSSLSEGFALVIVEAMECGVPVVSYQCPYGPKDLISEGKDGFLVPVGDEQMMADRICTLIEDEQLRRRMGVAAKDKAKQYHLDIIIDRWMQLFNDLVKT